MQLVIIFLFILSFSSSALSISISLQDESKIKQELKQLEFNKNPKDTEIIYALHGALKWISEANNSDLKSKSYQEIINNYPKIIKKLKQELLNENNQVIFNKTGLSLNELEHCIIKLSSQLLDYGRLIQQEEDKWREITESLSLFPRKLSESRRLLNESLIRFQYFGIPSTILAEAEYNLIQSEVNARKSIVKELELAQLSANNRQEISRIKLELYKKKYKHIDLELQNLRDFQNTKRQQNAVLALEHTKMLAVQSKLIPFLKKQLNINHRISQDLTKQATRINTITVRQTKISISIKNTRQVLTTIREQAEWINSSSTLGETLRSQISKLPSIPKSQQLDREMAHLRVQRLNYEDDLEHLNNLNVSDQKIKNNLTIEQTQFYLSLIKTRQELLLSLISGLDTEILELTKLNVATGQLKDVLKEVKDASNRYLFWVADVIPVTIRYPLVLITDVIQLLSLNIFSQFITSFKIMITTHDTFLYLLSSICFVIFNINIKKRYQVFLKRSCFRIGNVTQDRFYLTIKTIFWSIVVALPLPIMWSAIGYGFKNSWQYSIVVAIGYSISITSPFLLLFMISKVFSYQNGLFIAHFGWNKSSVERAMRYYRTAVFIIIPLVVLVIAFDHYGDIKFITSIGRFCFIILCISLSLITNNLYRLLIPVYINKNGLRKNIINHILWWIVLLSPIVSVFFSILGYFSTSKVLLIKLEFSLIIWYVILIIYHTIRRWMLIQRRKLAFERAKHKRAEILAQRAKNEEDNQSVNISNDVNIDIEEQMIDLNVISTQSVGLVKSILTMVTLVLLIWLWSELYTAFAFLENIRLWNITSIVNGVDTIQPVNMKSIFIVILIIVITTQLVRNFPALLELAILQHLDLTPGTGYAITTLTKYTITIVGIIIGFSMLGIDWSKLQWLIAAMGVGLGFGLQEIFANIISGLIILFEKPIRIGDTVTIRDLTGNVTKIKTRATILTDWDKKEIIVPNKAFITEQFINWSLSDSITRIVMIIPVTVDINSDIVTNIILKAVNKSNMVLKNPSPEIYLVDLQSGVQIFELRVYSGEIGHRLPVRHEIHKNILLSFSEYGITLPFPPFQASVNIIDSSIKNCMLYSNGSLHKTGKI